jgi:hypothetical protein
MNFQKLGKVSYLIRKPAKREKEVEINPPKIPEIEGLEK